VAPQTKTNYRKTTRAHFALNDGQKHFDAVCELSHLLLYDLVSGIGSDEVQEAELDDWWEGKLIDQNAKAEDFGTMTWKEDDHAFEVSVRFLTATQFRGRTQVR
jgi:hypothetical protein